MKYPNYDADGPQQTGGHGDLLQNPNHSADEFTAAALHEANDKLLQFSSENALLRTSVADQEKSISSLKYENFLLKNDLGVLPSVNKALGEAQARFQDEIAALKITVATQTATISNLNAVKAEADADELVILAKMNAGLSRPQATAVVKRQKQFDASKNGLKHAAKFAAHQAKKETEETESAPTTK